MPFVLADTLALRVCAEWAAQLAAVSGLQKTLLPEVSPKKQKIILNDAGDNDKTPATTSTYRSLGAQPTRAAEEEDDDENENEPPPTWRSLSSEGAADPAEAVAEAKAILRDLDALVQMLAL